MNEKSFRHYIVVETKNMSAIELQKLLNDATNDFPEKQIDHVIGTKIILGYESMLNARGRAEAAAKRAIEGINDSIAQNNLTGGNVNANCRY